MGGAARLIVLGSGTSVPRADRATSCYLVDDGAGTVLLVDLGPGALHRSATAGYDLDALSAVLLTHLHPDHCADLVALQFALVNPIPRARLGPLPVLAHPDAALLVARLRNAWPGWLAAGPGRLSLRPLAPGPVPLDGATRLEVHPVAHSATSLGFRLTLPDGFVVAFSGDAQEGAGLLELGRDADLLVLEAACPDERPVDGHLTPRRAGRVAAACGARHLLLTHFYPPTLQVPVGPRAREGFEGRLTLAQDGMVLPLVRRATAG